MKVNILDAHDRLLQFQKQADYISQGCQDCIKQRPEEFGAHAFYIFAHKRELGIDERVAIYNQDLQQSITNHFYVRKYMSMEQVPTHRLIWSPRLTKPKAQSNSMLFKYYPKTDQIKIIWIIPARELWEQYAKDNLTADKIVSESIHDFRNNPGKMELPEDDDLTNDQVNAIYTQISFNATHRKMMSNLYKDKDDFKLPTSEEFQFVSSTT